MPRTPGFRRYIFNTLTVVSLLLLPGVLATVVVGGKPLCPLASRVVDS